MLPASFVVTKVKTYFNCLNQTGSMKGRSLIELIPEVTYNYKEFQEPLIGQDN